MCKCLIDVGAFGKAGGKSLNLDGKSSPEVKDPGKTQLKVNSLFDVR